ncbi:DUF6049 family protein [Kineosporia sp. NBRC 101731]|uniref:DUF6049 family protein n=1 Tax=Kineosporia sp. NBRC 101731 TaxID=3032199 RepID=UPI0024A3381A|nr:DUF6049 family protein [Kineosporia sp. NBRC 101731]GLY26891.1 hypothetical protein Kisp02_02560 [Kineosporia sp. NBRC 101731]
MRYLANVRRGLTTGILTMAITLGVLGPSTAPALAASSRQAQPSNSTPEQVTTTSGGSSTSTRTQGSATASRNLQLTLSRVSPTSVTAQDDLVVTGVARNFSARALKNVTVSLRFSYAVLDGREAVIDWVENGDVATTSTLLRSQNLGNVRAKQSVPFTLTVPAGGLGLTSWGSSFGARPFSLVASSAAGRQLDAIRSTLVWAPQESDSKVGLTLLAPLTSVVPSTTAGLATEEAAAELLPDSRLSRILTATDDPAIGWAVDPALLAAAQSLKEGGISEAATQDDEEADGDDEATSSSSVSPSQPSGNEAATPFAISNEAAKTAGTAWLSRIVSGRKKRTVLGLPYADTDLNSLLKGGKSSGLLRQSDKLGESIEKKALGSSLYSRIAWPADGQISRQAIDGLVDTGHQSVILSESQQPAEPEISYTPNGKSTVRSKDNTLTGLLYDDELSDLFADSGRDRGAETTQTMLAVLAAISAESAAPTSDSQSRQVLAVAPRNWDPQPGDVQRLTNALREASWVSIGSLKKLGQSTAVDREAHRYGRKAVRSELPKGNLSNAQAMDRDLGNIAPALINNQDVVQRLEQRITSLLSYAWRSDLDGQAQARRAVMDDVGDLTGKVQLLIGTESKVFTARSALIPVTVDNKTDFDLRVSVSFSAGSGQLKIDRQPDPVTILAGHRQSFRVEATAIATGNVLVETKLLTGEGTKQRVLGSPQTFEVKVRPNWESWGMIGMAVLLGLLLLVGLLRSFRRNKTRPKVPLNSIPDVDDEATRAARKVTKEAAPPIATDGSPTPDVPAEPANVTDSAPIQRSGGATERSPQGSVTGDDKLRAPGTGSASGTPGAPRGMHEQKSSSVPTMAATKGAERRSPTMPKENR